MAEPTVPVRVSLIEQVVIFLDGVVADSELASMLRATLSQPTPTAEPCGWCDATATGTAEWQGGGRHPSCGAHGHDYTGEPANPPSIADMVPGTILRGRVRGQYLDRTLVATGHWYVDVFSRILVAPDDLDPSTIRDVTPPPAP